MIIYKITNRINGKIYIGQTTRSLEKRWGEHCGKESFCRLLHNAIQKYGKENFTVEQIDIACDRDELDTKEIYWIKFYDSTNKDKGYNLTSGGETRKVLSEASRLKMSISKKGKFLGSNNPNYGNKWTDERKHKLSVYKKTHYNWLRGKVMPIDLRIKIGNGNKKKVICIETGEVFDSLMDASEKKNVNYSKISECCNNKRKTTGGCHWRFVNVK